MSKQSQALAKLDRTPLSFGKYKNMKPEDIAEHDPSYIVWMYENVTKFPTCSNVLYRACKEDLVTEDVDDQEAHQMADSLAHAQYGAWGQG